MDTHLPDDRAVTQQVLVEARSSPGGPQRASPALPDDDSGIQLRPDYRDFCIPDVKFGKDLLADILHPGEMGVPARHAAAADDDRTAKPLAGGHHLPVVGLDGV